jgi:trk system potassium uptake protein TrkH
VTGDFDRWPTLSHAIIFGLFFVGGMAGSTAGGPKVIRLLLVVRVAFSQFFRLIHPRGFGAIKLGDRTVDPEVVLGVLGFLGMYVLLLGAGTGLICLLGTDLLGGFAAAAVTLGNIGPGFGGVGPSHTYEDFAPAAKLVMAGLMILGRLEIYTALVILTPSFWRR